MRYSLPLPNVGSKPTALSENGAQVHVLIGTEQFMTKKDVVFPEDMLVPGRSNSDEEERLARNAGRWKHVRFEAAEFRWFYSSHSEENSEKPKNPPELPQRRPKTKDARNAFDDLVRTWEPGAPHKKRVETIEWLRDEYDLSRDEARILWDELAPKEWRKRGRLTGKPAKIKSAASPPVLTADFSLSFHMPRRPLRCVAVELKAYRQMKIDPEFYYRPQDPELLSWPLSRRSPPGGTRAEARHTR